MAEFAYWVFLILVSSVVLADPEQSAGHSWIARYVSWFLDAVVYQIQSRSFDAIPLYSNSCRFDMVQVVVSLRVKRGAICID
jgi:hypothetical protein